MGEVVCLDSDSEPEEKPQMAAATISTHRSPSLVSTPQKSASSGVLSKAFGSYSEVSTDKHEQPRSRVPPRQQDSPASAQSISKPSAAKTPPPRAPSCARPSSSNPSPPAPKSKASQQAHSPVPAAAPPSATSPQQGSTYNPGPLQKDEQQSQTPIRPTIKTGHVQEPATSINNLDDPAAQVRGTKRSHDEVFVFVPMRFCFVKCGFYITCVSCLM
jgi:hypothetical protein